MKAYKRNMMLITVLAIGVLFCTTTSQAAVDVTGWAATNGKWSYTNPTTESGRLDEIATVGIIGPVWAVSDFVLPATSSFSMTVVVLGPSNDDDFMGLAFNYQDNDHFYLVDWKKETQFAEFGASVIINDDIAEQGIKFKKIDGSWTLDGLWGGTDGIGVSTLAGPMDGPTGGSWVLGTSYTFDVALSPGHILVNLNGSPLFDVSDSTFQGGRIAFYGFSQDNLLFSNVVVIPEPATLSLLGLGALLLRRRKR